jgi:hypothetical protein
MVYFLYPETRGLSLEQIDYIFEGKGRGWSCLTQGVRESVKGVGAIEAGMPEHLRRDVENGGHVHGQGTPGDKEGPTAIGVENANLD